MDLEEKNKIIQSIPQKGFLGHPKGLFTLFFTEFWERFSHYGMRALLLYYMYYSISKGGLGIDQATATSIMAIYGSLLFMSSIIGGWISDRLLGASKTVFWGGVLIMVGHLILALPGSIITLFISMLFLILGTGLLKPNISSMVGNLYSESDTRRDSGFSLFYMGINLGALVAPLIVGTLGQEYNFHLGFGVAAIGMIIGLTLFVFTKKKNLGLVGTQVPNPLTDIERKKTVKLFSISIAVIIILCAITIPTGILTINRFTFLISILGIIIPTCYFIYMYRSPKTTKIERSRLLAYIPLFIAATIFWAIQEQGAIILATYADQRTQLQFAGFKIHSAWFQSLSPIFIVTLAPIFAWIWVKLNKNQPSTTKKFAIGLLFAGFSFLIMILPAYMNGTESLVSPIWLVLSFFLIVIGEVCLSPAGLSITTKLAPSAFSAQTISLWFLSTASAQAINAQVVKLYNPATEIIYFGVIGTLSILVSIVLFMLSTKIQGFMKGLQ
ncbi:peptide MFS transporter [Bacillus sp. BH2]|uniref:peptide MFS transporter n=1 Tax=Bacillus sp. BH2 TaxID=2528958 RepID=UPI001064F1BD|nr:peptide MFS transporter [Bacillus sp. BH2]TEA45962.1 peptide MFS transporter [Bacillus sp. BH2]